MNEILKLTGVALIAGCFTLSFDAKGMNVQPSERANQPATQSTTATIPLGVLEALCIDKNQSEKDICEDIYTQALKLVKEYQSKEDSSITKWLANRWSMNRAQGCCDKLQSFDDDRKLEEFINKVRSEGFTIPFGDGEDSTLNVGKSIDMETDVRRLLYNEIKANVFSRLDKNEERKKTIEMLVKWYAKEMTNYIITNDQ